MDGVAEGAELRYNLRLPVYLQSVYAFLLAIGAEEIAVLVLDESAPLVCMKDSQAVWTSLDELVAVHTYIVFRWKSIQREG